MAMHRKICPRCRAGGADQEHKDTKCHVCKDGTLMLLAVNHRIIPHPEYTRYAQRWSPYITGGEF